MEKWARANYQPVLPMGEDGRRVTACKEHIALSQEAACEGMVLLKNKENILPLKPGSRVALFGKATFDYVKGGSGSGDVTVSHVSNLYDGLKAENVPVFEALASFYRSAVEAEYAQGTPAGMVKEPQLPETLLAKAAENADVAIISICRFQGEGYDGKWKESVYFENMTARVRKLWALAEALYDNGEYYLTTAEQTLVSAVKQRFHKVVVVLNVGNLMDNSWFCQDDRIQGVLLGWQGGMEGGIAQAKLLTGSCNPSGKLADTLARDLESYPSTLGFHESEDYVNYFEDIYVGYRYFHTVPGALKEVIYPFGFGLSYTSFAICAPTAIKENGQITVTVDVQNTGDRPGKEVVQLYYSAPQGKLGKPLLQLGAFRKTRLLEPGERQQLRLTLPLSQMASYDDLGKVCKSAYVLERGEYAFFVGNAINNTVKCADTLVLAEDMIVQQLSAKLTPSRLEKRLLSDGTYETLPTWEKPESTNVLTPLPIPQTQKVVPAIRGRARYSWLVTQEHSRKLLEVAQGALSLDDFIAQLPDEDLAELLGGQPNTGVGNCYGFGNNSKYGIPNIMTADGPAGLRVDKTCGVCATAWPCATLLACTWEPALVERIGAAGGAEVKENNLGVWLTPGLNIHRNPLTGRNFEYYSEDPLLSGKMAAAMIRGVQSNHIAATPKHLALNNKEVNRKGSDSRASERAIREIYLKGFEIAVKEADPWVIMSSYNIINGTRASENRELLEDILRQEWGFSGCVTTDWWTYGEHYREVKAGNDVKMGSGFPERLLEAKALGALTREEMEICAKRILALILKID